MAARLPLDIVLGLIDRASRPLSKVERRLGKFGKSAKRGGQAFTRSATVPIAALGFAAISTAASFEFSMNRVKAITGATGVEFAALNDQAKELGISTVFSARDAAEAQGNLALAGFKTNEIYSTTPAVLSLAAATNTELAESATVASKSLRAFNIPAADAPILTNALAIASVRANQTLSDLGESLKFAAPVAASFNLDFRETIALASRFADAGFEGSLGGTALSNMLVELAKISRRPGTQPFRVLESFGVDPRQIFDAEGKVKDLLGLIDALGAAGANGLDLGEIFGKRTFRPTVRLLSTGTESTRSLAAALNQQGEAARLAAIMNSGAYGAMKRLQAASEGLMISIGESGLLDVVAKVSEKFSGWFQNLSKTNPELLFLGVKVLAVTAAIGPFLLVLGSGSMLIANLASGILWLLPYLSGFASILFGTVIPAVWAFTVALLANPLTWIALAVVAVGAAIYAFATDLGGVRTKVLGLFSGLWSGIKSVGIAIWDFLSSIPARIVGAISTAFAWVKEKVSALVSWLPDFITGASEGTLEVQVSAAGGARTPSPRPAGFGGSGTKSQEPTKVVMEFQNMPRGASLSTETGSADLEVAVGYAHGGPLS